MKAKIAITLDEEILKLIKELAKTESRTISSQINKILRDFLEDKI